MVASFSARFLGLALTGPAGLAPARQPRPWPSRPTKNPWMSTNSSSPWPRGRKKSRRPVRGCGIARPNAFAPILARESFVRLLDGFPEKDGVPAVHNTGTIEGDDYLVEKLVYESSPGYFVSALLYGQKGRRSPLPGVLSPCGHSTIGKAADAYQILHINLAKRGHVVLTYDPVGQGSGASLGRRERAFALQPELRRTRRTGQPTLSPGHEPGAIPDLGRNAGPGLPDFASRGRPSPDRVRWQLGRRNADRIYRGTRIPRVKVAAIVVISRRTGPDGQSHTEDPSADPEQDIFGFLAKGSTTRVCSPCGSSPGFLATARFDFFPIEGAQETFVEAKRLYEVAGVGDGSPASRRPSNTD